MIIPTQYIPIRPNRPKPVKGSKITLEKAQTEFDSAKRTQDAHVILYEKREGRERRQRNIKPMLDTRVGRDRRYNQDNPGIDIKA